MQAQLQPHFVFHVIALNFLFHSTPTFYFFKNVSFLHYFVIDGIADAHDLSFIFTNFHIYNIGWYIRK